MHFFFFSPKARLGSNPCVSDQLHGTKLPLSRLLGSLIFLSPSPSPYSIMTYLLIVGWGD